MTAFVSTHVDLSASTVLDLGCGYGGISLAFAQRSQLVISADQDAARLAEVQKRVRDDGVANMLTLKLKGEALPFESARFDVVLLNGVLEYMGVNAEGADPERLQLEALKEIRRVLRPGGVVYLGIENRYYPGYLNKDVHCGLPLVSMIPRRAANLISKLAAGRPFQHYIHSAWGLARLFRRAGYAHLALYAPLFNYQYPIVYMPAERTGSVRAWLRRADEAPVTPEYRRMSFGRLPEAKKLLFLTLGWTGLMKLLSPCFVVMATRAPMNDS
jgi:SAM-dependent methyltransferase